MNVLNSEDSQPRCLEESTTSPSNEKWENLFHLCSICFSFQFIVISFLLAPEHKTVLQPWHCKGKANFPPEWTPVQITLSAFCYVILHACAFYTSMGCAASLAKSLLWRKGFFFFLQQFYAFSKLFLKIFLGLPKVLYLCMVWFYI